MNFMLGNIPICHARNIEWKDNGDGTSQLWFNAFVKDPKSETEIDARFHIFRLSIDGVPLISMQKNDKDELWEMIRVDSAF